LIVLALYGLELIIRWGTVAVSALLFLRVLLTWIGANPFGRIPYHLTRITEPLVRPVRSQFGGGRHLRFRFDPFGMGVQLSSIIAAIGRNIMSGAIVSATMMGELIKLVGLLYVVAIFLRFFL